MGACGAARGQGHQGEIWGPYVVTDPRAELARLMLGGGARGDAAETVGWRRPGAPSSEDGCRQRAKEGGDKRRAAADQDGSAPLRANWGLEWSRVRIGGSAGMRAICTGTVAKPTFCTSRTIEHFERDEP